MNSRRSFLRMLGLSAVAAPVAAKAMQAEAIPVDAWPPTNSEFRSLLTAQREINRLHSSKFAAIDDYGYRVWIDWAKQAKARG